MAFSELRLKNGNSGEILRRFRARKIVTKTASYAALLTLYFKLATDFFLKTIFHIRKTSKNTPAAPHTSQSGHAGLSFPVRELPGFKKGRVAWRKLKHEAELVTEALRIGEIYARKRGVGAFEATDSAHDKITYLYRLLVHDKLIQPLAKGHPEMKHKLALSSPTSTACWSVAR